MGWREWADSVLAAGLGPEDCDEPEHEPPTEIVVNVVKPELCTDGEWHDCQTFRSFPLFMNKAALRWADYWRRKHGKGNVRVEYE